MRRSVAILLGVLAPLGSGCGSDAFLPPPPASLKPTADPAFEPAAKVIEMVVRPLSTTDRDVLVQLGRMDSGTLNVSFRSSVPEAGAPPQRQAELIRKAAARGASALIVEAEPDPKVAEALKDVQSLGTRVLLLARPLPGHEQEFPLITLEPPLEAARSVVKAVIEDAQSAKLPSDGKAVILTPSTPDLFSDDQLAALKTAATEAGIAAPEVIVYGMTQADAGKLVFERIKSDPKLTFVFAVDGEALMGTLEARRRVKNERNFIVGGFAELYTHMNQMLYDQAAGIADRHMGTMAHTAMRQATRLANGEQVPERTTLPIAFRRFSSKVAPDLDRPGSSAGAKPEK